MNVRYLWDDNDDPVRNESSKKEPPAPPKPLTVSQLNEQIKQALDRFFSHVWLEGEISELSRATSGHVYLTLKDEQSQIRAVMWKSVAIRQKFELKDGMKILCQGRVDVYPPRGTYQISIQTIEPKGIGQLQLAFQQLHAKLAKEGLFSQDRKKRIPSLPKRIGFVTSPTGAAIFDFLEVLRRRWNDVEIYIFPSRVQGEGSVQDIVHSLKMAAQARPMLDVLVVGRGGGSIEDLWTFNDEEVVRAVAACPIPTISAVGHEIDVTLCDLAADLRALTPSEAAERVVPEREYVAKQLRSLEQHAHQLIATKLSQWERRLHELRSRPVLSRPIDGILLREQRLDGLQIRLDQALQNRMARAKLDVIRLAKSLDALNPLRVLARGYSLTRRLDGTILHDSSQIGPGQIVETILDQGMLVSRVESTKPRPSDLNAPGLIPEDW